MLLGIRQVLVIYYIVPIIIALSGDGPLCLSCSKVVQPRDCNHVTICGKHEQCYVSRTISDSGITWFNVGCKDSQRCAAMIGKRSDTNVCQSCCNDRDLCNRNGCRATERPSSEGTLCFNCIQQLRPDMCDDITLCGSDKSCFVRQLPFGSDILFSTGCMSKSSCSTSNESFCCDNELCNDIYPMKGYTTIINEGSHLTKSPPRTTTPRGNEHISTTNIPATTDRSECTNGWHYFENSKYCLLFDHGVMTLSEAQIHCKQSGLHLPIIESSREQEYLKRVLEPLQKTIWLDGTDEKEEGKWIWNATGQPINYVNWSPGEPDHYFGDHSENCMEYGPTYSMQWNDAPCHNNTRKNYVMCETGLKVSVPNCPTIWVHKDHYMYCIMDFKDTWNVAKETCKTLSAHLPVADTQESFRRIGDVVGRNHDIYLDGNDVKNNNNWVWTSTGVKFTFTHWADGEPNNNGGKTPENCLEVVSRTEWRWNDAPCDRIDRVDKLVCERYHVDNHNIFG